MPMHDWEPVEAGIYHAFHHWWISEISDLLNSGLLPKSMYALPEQVAAGFGPDVLTLQGDDESVSDSDGGMSLLTQTKPKVTYTARLIGGVSPRRKSLVAVRHVTGDRVVAMIEIVSPGNKSSAHAFRSFVQKAGELLEQHVHLLIIDPLPPGPRDHNGIHAAIWDEIAGQEFVLPSEKPLTFAAYQVENDVIAHVETIAIGDRLPDMPLFLTPTSHILVPLENSYESAWRKMPARWQRVIASM